MVQVKNPKTSEQEKQKGRKSGNYPDPKDPALLNHPFATLFLRHSAPLPLCHSTTSVTVVLAVILVSATLASSQTLKLYGMCIHCASTSLLNTSLRLNRACHLLHIFLLISPTFISLFRLSAPQNAPDIVQNKSGNI